MIYGQNARHRQRYCQYAEQKQGYRQFIFRKTLKGRGMPKNKRFRQISTIFKKTMQRKIKN